MGYGNGSFENPVKYAMTSLSECVVVADFNDDMHLDLIVSYDSSHSIGVFLGYANGSFGNQILYLTNFSPYFIAVGDFNNDMLLDIVATDAFSAYVNMLLHHSKGTLASEMTYRSADGSRLRCIAIADINNDNRLDIVTANYGTNNVGILLGQGNGSFDNQKMFATGDNSHPYSITIGDFSKDGKLGIAVTNYDAKSVGILLGDGNGMFVRQTDYETSSNFTPFIVAASDFNNDGQSEIVVAYNDTDDVNILVSYDIGVLILQNTYSISGRPCSIVAGDFNNDTYLDIAIVYQISMNLGVFLGYGNGSFANQITYSIGSTPSELAVGDFNKDTHLDIIVTFL
jgi:hypothetical protein